MKRTFSFMLIIGLAISGHALAGEVNGVRAADAALKTLSSLPGFTARYVGK